MDRLARSFLYRQGLQPACSACVILDGSPINSGSAINGSSTEERYIFHIERKKNRVGYSYIKQKREGYPLLVFENQAG